MSAPPPSARYVIIEWSLECLLKKAYTIPSSAHHLLLDQFFPFLLLATNLLKTLSRGPPPPLLCFCYLWSVLFFSFLYLCLSIQSTSPVPSSLHPFSSPFILCSVFLSLRSSLAPLRCPLLTFLPLSNSSLAQSSLLHCLFPHHTLTTLPSCTPAMRPFDNYVTLKG